MPIAALATSLAAGIVMPATILPVRAAEAEPMAYVLDGLDGPDFVTAPGPAGPQFVAARLAPASPGDAEPAASVAVPAMPAALDAALPKAAPVQYAFNEPLAQPFFDAQFPPSVFFARASLVQPVVPLLAATRAVFAPVLPPAIPQPQPQLQPQLQPQALSEPKSQAEATAFASSIGDLTAPEPTEMAAIPRDANGELLPLESAQPPQLGAALPKPAAIQPPAVQPPAFQSAAVQSAGAPSPKAQAAVLSRLDGPGPLPAPRPLTVLLAAADVPPSTGTPAATGAVYGPTTDPEAAPVSDAVSGPAISGLIDADPDPDPAPSSAAAPAPVLPGETESLTDAIIASLKGNPEIQIALAQQDDAKYGVREAQAGYLPKVDLTGGWGRELARTVPQDPTQRFRTEATISLNQNLWDFGVTINDIKRARATYRAAQWGTREKIEAISYEIANAYLGVLLQQKLVKLAEDEIASIKKILRIITVQKDLGLTTPADVERAQTRLENVRSQLLDRTSALEQARNAYKRLTNHMPLTAADVPAAGQALPESAEAAVDLIDVRSPRLAQAVEDRRSLDKQYDSQADTTLPRFGLTVASDYRRDVLGATGRAFDARAMLTFSYQIYNGGATTAIKRRIGARLRQADYELDRRRREVEQDIRIDYAGLGAAKEKIATIEDEITSATRVADLYKQQFRGGRRTVFDLLDSQQLLFGARAKQIANQLALRAAEYRVLQKLGGLFDLVSGGQPLPALAVPAPGSDD